MIRIGKDKVIEMNIPKMRDNKQRRKKRFKSFLNKLYDKVNTREDQITKELTAVNREIPLAYNVSFRQQFKRISTSQNSVNSSK